MDDLMFDPEYRNILLRAERRFRQTWINFLYHCVTDIILIGCVVFVKSIFFIRDLIGLLMSLSFTLIIIPLEILLFVCYVIMVIASPSESQFIDTSKNLLDFNVIHYLFWGRQNIATCNKFRQLKPPSEVIIDQPRVRTMDPFQENIHSLPGMSLRLRPSKPERNVFVSGWRPGEVPIPPSAEQQQANENINNSWISETIDSYLPDIKSRLFANTQSNNPFPVKSKAKPKEITYSSLPRKDRFTQYPYGKGGSTSKSDELHISRDFDSSEDDYIDLSSKPPGPLHYGRRILSKVHDLANNYTYEYESN